MYAMNVLKSRINRDMAVSAVRKIRCIKHLVMPRKLRRSYCGIHYIIHAWGGFW